MSKQAITTRDDEQANAHCFTPRVDIWETADALHLELEMPGVAPDSVDVHLENQVLEVLGRVAPQAHGEKLHAEYQVGNFERAFRISERIDGDANTASFGLWPEVSHGAMGRVRVDGMPVHLSETDWEISRGGPCLGEHNQKVFGDLLGYTADELDAFREQGVI